MHWIMTGIVSMNNSKITINYGIIIGLLWLLFSSHQSIAQPFLGDKNRSNDFLPRTILVIYQSKKDEDIFWTEAHKMAQMPLNHLGYNMRFHRLENGLPDLSQMPNVHGILTWFAESRMENPAAYIKWATKAITKHHKKFVVIGNSGFEENLQGKSTPIEMKNQFWKYLGLTDVDQYYNITFDVKVAHINRQLMGFEHRLRSPLPIFKQMEKINDTAVSHLALFKPEVPDSLSHLIITHLNGGYIASDFTHFYQKGKDGEYKNLWYINPFKFFRLAFGTEIMPKPDTTTINGRRIYYSHIDGDGWRNVTEILKYKKSRLFSSEVILKEIIRKYPDLPLTVAPVVGDIDPNWYGSEEALRIARDIFKESNVEAGSHTYSHPLQWDFFNDKNINKKEAPFLTFYPYKKSKVTKGIGRVFGITRLKPNTYQNGQNLSKKNKEKQSLGHYSIPRAYAVKPYSTSLEIKGSVDFINKLLPKGKRTEVVQWSGNTLPYLDALKICEEINVRNLNGGDTRFDREFPSYSAVSPLGRSVGKYWQVYASNSNENTYTDLWTDRFFGFRFLVRTFRNTETPIRIKPLNIYYHMYSGEKLSSLNALKRNLNYVRSQPLIPVSTSHFAGVVDGFNRIKIKKIGKNRWQFYNRGLLQTIRFDHSTFKAVDFTRSKGIIGQIHFQGSLYVHLDPAVEHPILKIKNISQSHQVDRAKKAYIIDSKWLIKNFKSFSNGLKMQVSGFGDGDMRIYIPSPYEACNIDVYKKYKWLYSNKQIIKDNQIHLKLKLDAIKPIKVKVTCKVVERHY